MIMIRILIGDVDGCYIRLTGGDNADVLYIFRGMVR